MVSKRDFMCIWSVKINENYFVHSIYYNWWRFVSMECSMFRTVFVMIYGRILKCIRGFEITTGFCGQFYLSN